VSSDVLLCGEINAGSLLERSYNWEEEAPYIDNNEVFWLKGSKE
jgi:hypothetical protein